MTDNKYVPTIILSKLKYLISTQETLSCSILTDICSNVDEASLRHELQQLKIASIDYNDIIQEISKIIEICNKFDFHLVKSITNVGEVVKIVTDRSEMMVTRDHALFTLDYDLNVVEAHAKDLADGFIISPNPIQTIMNRINTKEIRV